MGCPLWLRCGLAAAGVVAVGEGPRYECAALFTCEYAASMHLHLASMEHDSVTWSTRFHALAGQREVANIAKRLVAALAPSLAKGAFDGRAIAAQARDALLARRNECREALKTADLDPCAAPANATVLTLASHPVYARDVLMDTTVERAYFFLHGDDRGSWRRACDEAARAVRSIALAAADELWFPRIDGADFQYLYGPGSETLGEPRDGAGLCDIAGAAADGDAGATRILARNAAQRRAHKEAKEDFVRIGPKRAFLLRSKREMVGPRSPTLHVYTAIFYPSGHHALGQFLAYYRRRVPDVTFTLIETAVTGLAAGGRQTFKHDENFWVKDGRLAIAEAYDAEILIYEWNSVDAYNWAALRNALWQEQESGPRWVGFPDLDEYVDISAAALDLWERAGVDVVKCVGVQLSGTSRDFSKATRGGADKFFNKLVFWRPATVENVYTTPGNHDAAPEPAESLKWAVADLYHVKHAAHAPFDYGDGRVLEATCGRSHEARSWRAFYDASHPDIFGAGAGLEGLEPCSAPGCAVPHDADAVAAAIAGEPPECAHDTSVYLDTYGPTKVRQPGVIGDGSYYACGVPYLDAAPWSWSLSHFGQRAWPPYLKSADVVDDAADRTPELSVETIFRIPGAGAFS